MNDSPPINVDELSDHPIVASVRLVFFQTEFQEYPHATHGGTLFIVRYCGRPYGLTCKHVFGDFPPEKLHVTARTDLVPGRLSAKVQNLGFASNLGGAAIGSDMDDLCVIEFADGLAEDFFGGTEFPIDRNSVGTSKTGHILCAIGISKEKSRLLPHPDGNIALNALPLRDVGTTCDPILRRATARYGSTEFQTLAGMSGSPVLDLTANVLCGMVIRGTFQHNRCEILYADISDIVKLIETVRNRTPRSFYYK
jgi:hypothetical protein